MHPSLASTASIMSRSQRGLAARRSASPIRTTRRQPSRPHANGWPNTRCLSSSSSSSSGSPTSRWGKTSTVPKFAANLTMLFGELPFVDRFAAARAAGFDGVEYLFPYDFDKAELREQWHQHGLAQVLQNLPAGDWAAGERGIAILPDRVDEFRDGVARGIDYAKALDCRQLNCLVGIAPDGADMVELNEVLVNNLR